MMASRRPLLQAILAICLLGAGCSRVQPPDPRLTALSGSLWSVVCDNSACDCPPAGDPHWESVRLTPSGVDRPVAHKEGVGWIRLDFTIDNISMYRNPAILISNPADAEQLFMNGTYAGGEGVIGTRYETVPGPVRVVEFPQGALRNGRNVLTMRVLYATRNVDYFDGPFLIGNANRVRLAAERMQLPVIGLEAAYLSLFGLIIAFYSLLLSKTGVRIDYMLFIAFTANYAVTFFLGSRTFHVMGFGGHLADQINVILSVVTSLLMVSLVTAVTGSSFGPVYLLLAAATVAFIGLYAVLPPLPGLMLLTGPRKVHLALLGLYYIAVSVRSVLNRRIDSIPILAGVIAYVIGSRIEEFWGLNFRDLSMGAFILCMLYSLTARHARMQSRLVMLSSRLLDAHEEERRRIARDIHDSVGQSLLAMKLRLQMLSSEASEGSVLPRETIDDLARDTGGILEEVRRTTMDLRPSFIEKMSLMEAVEWYAGSFMERSGIELCVHGGEEELPELPERVKDNLYRALQEILSNVRKHSGATLVHVSLYRNDRNLVLKVTDNGSGIDLPAARKSGIGLETMRERAELLGGTCNVDGIAGRGTTVTIEVPLK